MGAIVQFCGHNGCFIADIYEIEGANVVRASGPVTAANLDRRAVPTHHVSDFPKPGFWRPELGVFVVPKRQVRELVGGAISEAPTRSSRKAR
jgi:hypothetical protein